MNFFPLDIRKLILAITLIVLPFVVLNATEKKSSSWILAPFSFAGSLLQGSYSFLDHSVRSTVSRYVDLLAIKDEIAQLKSQNLLLETKMNLFSELEAENERLRGLLEFKKSSAMDLLPARVIGRDLLIEHESLSVNRGTNHGVKKGMAVTSTTGVVGYVLRSQPNSATVLLVTDRYAVVDALVQRTRARGIVEGQGPGLASLRYLERLEDVKVGDLVVTNGLDNIFPKGFPIATVSSVQKANRGISIDVQLKPIVDSSAIEEIFIILNARDQNFLEEEP